jgi:hypothetical protein
MLLRLQKQRKPPLSRYCCQETISHVDADVMKLEYGLPEKRGFEADMQHQRGTPVSTGSLKIRLKAGRFGIKSNSRCKSIDGIPDDDRNLTQPHEDRNNETTPPKMVEVRYVDIS